MTEQFETWFADIIRPAMKANGIRLAESDLVLEISKMAWQASRDAIVIELDKCNCDNGEESVWDDAIEYCEATLRAAGITVKGDN